MSEDLSRARLQWMFDNQPMGEGAPPQLPVLEKSILQSEQRASSRQMRRKHFGFQALALRADMLAFFRWKIPQLDVIDFRPIRTLRIQMPF